MVWPSSVWANWMVSPLLAAASTARSVPADPSSAALLTSRVLSKVRSSRTSRYQAFRLGAGFRRARRRRSRADLPHHCGNDLNDIMARISQEGAVCVIKLFAVGAQTERPG